MTPPPPPAHGRPAEARPVLLVSHGFQKNYERAFANGLAAAGVPCLLVSSDQTETAALAPGVRTLNLRGSQREDRPRWAKALNLLRYHLALMAWVAWHRPPVVHVFGLLTPTWLVGALEGWWFRLFAGRYVLTVHDTEPHDVADAAHRRAFLAAFRRAQHLVVHTRRVAAELAARLGAAAPPITVMEHGLEPLPDLTALQPYPGNRPVRLLLFGALLRYKGLDLLLEALRELALPFELQVAGKCRDPALKAELQAQLAQHPRAAQVHWQDAYVAEDALTRLFLQADVLVLPYRRIDQSGVLLQAYRHGLPIVASRVGAFEDYVGPERGELCEPGDAASLRAAIERLAARLHTLDRRRLAEAATALHWPRVVRVLLPLYGAPAVAGRLADGQVPGPGPG